LSARRTALEDPVNASRPRRWKGAAWVAWRTRKARRAGDVGGVVRSVARGSTSAVAIKVGRQRILLLLDPSLVGELLVEHAAVTTKGPGVQLTRQMLGNGLLTSEGRPHDLARKLIAPAFSPRRLAGYTDAFADRTRARTAGWRDGETLDIHDEMACLTLDIVGRTLLGIDLSDSAPQIRGSLDAALERFGEVGGGSLLIGGAGGRRVFGGRGKRTARAVDTPHAAEADVHRVVDEVIEEHRRNPPSDDRGDVVSALLSDGQVRAGMTNQEIHDHVITLIMAGHETTANALTWALFLLGRHPDIQARLHEEVDRLPTDGPRFSQLPDLPFTRAVISEAMRLYPPAWVLGRTLVAPLDFAGWQAPAGTLVGVSPLLLHHDPRWFDRPADFDPDRWLDGRQKSLPRNAYLPFGTGPRACIGEQFAWAEAMTVLAMIASRWTIRTPPELTPRAQYRVTLRPSGPVPLQVAARTAAALDAPKRIGR
jgi:cytochrome P450